MKGIDLFMQFLKGNFILKNKFIFSCAMAFIYYTVSSVSVLASSADVNNVDFWRKNLKNGDAVIMNSNDITKYNKEILRKQPTTNYDLKNYPKSVKKAALQTMLQENDFPTGYVNGQAISVSFKNQILSNMNLGAAAVDNPVKWGLAVRRSSLRLYPASEGIFDDADDQDFDSLQATILNPGEAVAILYRSADLKWNFVQSNNYRGWVLADNIAETNYKEWLKWQNPDRFLVVTAAELNLQTNSETLLLEMGSHLPVIGKNKNNYIVKLPQRQGDGKAVFIKKTVSVDDQVHLGNLPYTRANIIQQAFKFYGQPYGWGGLENSVDCSSFVMDIYRSFGFMMPRDADTQEVAVGRVQSVTPQNVQSVLDSTLPGATLHMDGHVMLYLGHMDDQYYVINSLGSYGDSNNVGSDGRLARVPVMQVVTTDIKNTPLRNGKSFMEGLRTVKEWQY